MNEGAKLANEANARRAEEVRQDAIIKRLDQIIALLAMLVKAEDTKRPPRAHAD